MKAIQMVDLQQQHSKIQQQLEKWNETELKKLVKTFFPAKNLTKELDELDTESLKKMARTES